MVARSTDPLGTDIRRLPSALVAGVRILGIGAAAAVVAVGLLLLLDLHSASLASSWPALAAAPPGQFPLLFLCH